MSKHFCLFFNEPLEVVHFGKQPIKIPEVVGRHTDWKITVVRHSGTPDSKLLPLQRSEAPHVHIETLSGPVNRHGIATSYLRYIVQHAREIDFMMLLSTGRHVAAYGALYKLLNPNGFLWNKLDLHEEYLLEYGCLPVSQSRYSPWNWLQRHYGQVVDLITAESQGTYQIVKDHNPEVQQKIRIIPCGIESEMIHKSTWAGERESIILTVARLGVYQKATEVLLEAFAKSGLWKSWKLALVGPVAPEFEPWLANFARDYPEVWSAVLLVGPIQDRNELAKWFLRSKVFCMPSRYECSAMSLVEAGAFGCAPVSTNFCGAIDMLDNGRCGVLCAKGDVDDLSNALLKLCTNETLIQEYGQAFQRQVLQHYTWDTIIENWLTIVAEMRPQLQPTASLSKVNL